MLFECSAYFVCNRLDKEWAIIYNIRIITRILCIRNKVESVSCMRIIKSILCLLIFSIPYCIGSIYPVCPTKTVSGVVYCKHRIKDAAKKPIEIHIIEVDPMHVDIVLAAADERSIYRAPVSLITTAVGGYCAVNASFYRRGGMHNGNLLGFAKIGDIIISDPCLPQGALGWSFGNSAVEIDRIETVWTMYIGTHICQLDRVNQPRADDEAVLYTSAFGARTLTKSSGYELIIQNGRIQDIKKGCGNNMIPSDGCVYSIGDGAVTDQFLSAIQDGNSLVQMSFAIKPLIDTTKSIEWNMFDYIVAGTPLLVKSGKVIDDVEEELDAGSAIVHTADEIAADFHRSEERRWFVHKKNPRTAIGIRADGHWLFVVVDGRSDRSVGMTLPELADYMVSLGCIDALNLGGGGCSTMYVGDRVVNVPSGSTGEDDNHRERPVANAIVVIPKNKQ